MADEKQDPSANVEVKMPDGVCDAAFIHPASGSYPGVLIWPDAERAWTKLIALYKAGLG